MISGIKKQIIIIFSIFVASIVLMPVSYANNGVNSNTNVTTQETLSSDFYNRDTTKLTHKKTKNEKKQVMSKFIHSMLLVFGSCLAISFLLLLYKKLSQPKIVPTRDIDISKDLNTPQTIEDATKFFIEKF